MNPNEVVYHAQILTLLTEVQDRVMQCQLDLLHADYDDGNAYSELSNQLDYGFAALYAQIRQIQNLLKEEI